jgi:hypothetical protein
MAYSVEQRTQEMGVRMALGAGRAAIRKLVVWHGMRLAQVGVAIGISAAFGLTRFIASFLFGVNAWDPLVFATVPIVLSIVALLAVWSRLHPPHASNPSRPSASSDRALCLLIAVLFVVFRSPFVDHLSSAFRLRLPSRDINHSWRPKE